MAVNGKLGLPGTRTFKIERAQPVQGPGPTTARRPAGRVVRMTKNTLHHVIVRQARRAEPRELPGRRRGAGARPLGDATPIK